MYCSRREQPVPRRYRPFSPTEHLARNISVCCVCCCGTAHKRRTPINSATAWYTSLLLHDSGSTLACRASFALGTTAPRPCVIPHVLYAARKDYDYLHNSSVYYDILLLFNNNARAHCGRCELPMHGHKDLTWLPLSFIWRLRDSSLAFSSRRRDTSPSSASFSELDTCCALATIAWRSRFNAFSRSARSWRACERATIDAAWRRLATTKS